MFKKKFLAALSAAGILGLNAQGFSAANPFNDLPAEHWAYGAIVSLASEGNFNGYGDGTFRGDRNITRYEAATLLAKISGFKAPQNNFDQNLKFTDIPKEHWAYPYVGFATKKEIAHGYDDNTFRGDKYITRYEMAQMISNFLELNADSNKNKNPFADIISSHWATNSVINLATNKIIEGYGDGTFKGNRNITRYEAAVIVARAEALKVNR